MKVQYVLVDDYKTTRTPYCTTCEKNIYETTVWYSFRGTDDLCFECWNAIRNMSIKPENNPNPKIDSSIIETAGMEDFFKKEGLKSASIFKRERFKS